MKKRKKKERIIPMPTEEDKMRAQLKAASADPLVWAMKTVDDEFPDTREKDIETVKAEAAVEETDDIEDDEDILDEEIDEEPVEKKESGHEIKAEGKTALPLDEGVMTVEVTPMRQDVSGVSPDEAKKSHADINDADIKEKAPEAKGKKVHSIKKSKKAAEPTDGSRMQVKLTSLESKQKKMMLGFAVLVLLAIGGVTFGVVAMVRQSQTTADLESQIAAASGQDEGIDSEYITLKDWGLKIKIVTGLTDLSYNIQTDDFAEVLIWGAKQDKSANYTPDFAKQNKNSNPLGTVVRVPRYERAAAGRLIWYDDYYNYYYQGPSGVPTVSEDEMSWWVESYLLIKEMLTNADNYIKIDDSTIGQQ